MVNIASKNVSTGTHFKRMRGKGWAAGFSLLEVMLATTVMALGLAAGIVGLQLGMRDLDSARASTAVSQALQNEAERLRMMNWTSISALPSSGSVDVSTTVTTGSILNGRLAVTRTIADVSGYTNMKEIVLQAVWKGMDGQVHTRVYRMRYGKGGLHDYYYSSASG